MFTRKIPVEIYIEQVRDGYLYKGHVTIAKHVFDYEFKFAIPIPLLDNIVIKLDDYEKIRHLFNLVIKRDGAEIELTNPEFFFFFELIGQFIMGFYYDPAVRHDQSGFLGKVLRNGVTDSKIHVLVASRSSGLYGLTPEICQMLNRAKFGCKLIA